jgi:dUTP pyrophosphatase
MEKLKLKRLYPDVQVPSRETHGSVGYDIKAYINDSIEILPGQTELISTGFAIELDYGYAVFIYARSGLGIKKGIIPANCVGVIDSDYRGEIKVGLRNNSLEKFIIKNGDRIAQMVIIKCEIPEITISDELNVTERDGCGFGSTGTR